MTGLFGFRQRAEQFAALVDGRAGDARERADGPPQRHHPDQERWLSVVSQLRAQDELVAASLPAPAYAASLREALVAEAATVLTSGPTTAERSAVPDTAAVTGGRAPLLGGPRRLVAAATVAVVVTGSAGMASAAQTALPGAALYPVKRGLERVDVTLSSSAVGRGRDLLGQASTRLGEVEGLLASGSPTAALEVPGTLRTFTWQAREGAEAMMEAYRQTEDFFLVHVREHEVDTAGFEELEVAAMLEHRWWTPQELRATDAVVYPADLVEVLGRAAGGAWC